MAASWLSICSGTITQVRFVIMGNLFCSDYSIHRRFDLKGSSLGRTTDKPQTEIDEYTTLKDLDLNFIFRLQKHWYQEFQRWAELELIRNPNNITHINVEVKSVEAGKWTGTASFLSRKISWIIVSWLVYILGILGIGYWPEVGWNKTILIILYMVTMYLTKCIATLLEGSFDSDSSRGSSPHLSRGDTDPNR